MDMIFIFVCYVFIIAALCYVIYCCYEQIRYTRELLNNEIEKRELQWFYTKTKLGRLHLEAAKRRAASKEHILFRKVLSAVIMTVFTLILFHLIIDLFQNGFPNAPVSNPR